ncbi:hypothetical protein CEP52_016434 [Fusarium oligoseptatum]|uniref:Methyltransferase n=1 Tax=Fusarium oligoseptatum TaxID=2604345 RepID=A0A428S3P7_9HYPO|nr:hypothetical protein CEP52_016434 [Fusarium oligoseptatum]
MATPSVENITPAKAPADFHHAQHWASLRAGDTSDGDASVEDDVASSTESISSSILHYRTIHGRTYHSERGNAQYWTPNDEHHNESMDINHHLLSLSLNGKLHLAPLKDDIKKVVDIGTGTGIWAIISDWSALFKEAFRVCKPGGWVESYEASPRMESDDGSVTETCAINEWGKFFIEGGKKLNRTFEILDKDLQKKGMEEAGFVDVQTWDFKAPIGGWAGDPRLKEIGQFAQAALEQDYEGYVLFMANMVLGWSKEEVSTYCAQLRREIRSGRFHPFYRQRVVYGRKPE